MEIMLSFIIPAHNEEDRLRRCLDKILEQQEYGIEILCIDDSSNDHTLEIMQHYAIGNTNIKVFHNKENMGAGYSRNLGLREASGKYIWFVDADDYILEDTVKYLIDCAEQDNLDVLSFASIRRTEIENYSRHCLENDTNIITGEELFFQISQINALSSSVCLQIYSRQYLLNIEINFREGAMAEDAYFAMKALILASKAKYVHKECYVYEKSQDSVTTTTSDSDYFIGVFSAYCDMSQFWNEKNWNKALSRAMARRLGLYYQLAEKYFKMSDKDYINRWMEKENGYVEKQYQLFLPQNENYYLGELDRKTIDIIENSEEIIIYGAGNVAKEFLNLVNKLEKRVIAYAVSKGSKNNPKALYGVPIVEIEELLEYKKTALVVIAVVESKKQGILDRLNELGFIKILQIT